jgi:serine/threonine-protein kinase
MGAELAINPPAVGLVEGAVIGGRYQVMGVVSYGAMGIIYRVRHRTLGIDLALKAMRSELVEEDSYHRFADEARNAAQLKSEHVARVFDFGRLPGGELYLVMELLEGEDLMMRLTESGPLPVDLVRSIALQACAGLAEAHKIGIIHRDLKPENLFLSRTPNDEPLLKIVDFGVSKRLRGPRRSATIAGIVGSPHYMAPEQLRSSRDIDHRADIWSLGAVLYELLAGRPAFEGDNVAEICASVLTVRPPPVDSLRPEVGSMLSAVVMRCLEVDRLDRFQSMAELADALRLASGERIGSSVWPVLLADQRDSEPVVIPGLRGYRWPRIAAATLGGLLLLATIGTCATLGPRRTVDLARRTAASELIGGARAQRVPQSAVERPKRAIVPAKPPEQALPAATPPPPSPKPKPWRRHRAKPVEPELVVLPETKEKETAEAAALTETAAGAETSALR